MPDINTILLVLQSSSLAVSITLLLFLVFSRRLHPDTTKSYESVRWLLVLAMFLMSMHYALQMAFGFRAKGDDVGAIVNILFYSPVVYILSYSVVRIGCGDGYRRKHLRASAISLSLIIATFLYGYLHYGSLHMIGALHMMGLLFFLTMVYFVVYPTKEMHRVRKLIDEESGQEPVQFNQYLRTGLLFLDAAGILVTFSIFYIPALAILGPLFFVSLIFFVICFIALGFNIRQVKNLISEDDRGELMQDGSYDAEYAVRPAMSDEQKHTIHNLLEEWRKSGGYVNTELNSTTLAIHLHIPRRQLVQYLRENEGKTFRVWLSDLRMDEAKRLLAEHPEYTNEAIAEACGFSRSRLQVKFKEVTGLTINEWRETL